ncbi:LacI family transcriptional regulator [Tamaricihabitans halophyticus]|uniref:LacI family transcriptional regulator n=1 Tax=Tamaricihabitans halophyticus TaxID=1262583 RepID=A0A4R2QCU1_9PSEU|nr:LacI family DNA-binding transcriptional regulator [Tamaricihabitans halophyticus]TCP44781.1 LacI family transcriptional regulator [Tamaricihabitans halophyticus]
MATINDVATMAGVSTATVSRALNGVASVDPELCARVVSAAKELGYQPNGPARNLRRQETAVLGLIISDVANPFFTAIARGVEDVAQAVGYSVVLCNTDEDAAKERRYLDVAIQERVAGVIMSPTDSASNADVLREHGIPVVAVDRPLAGSDRVLVDTRMAAEQATKHLLDQGYRRIGCVAGPSGVQTADDRLAGYADALVAAGVEHEPRLVRHAEYRGAGAHGATLALRQQPDPPDALLIANSSLAIGALEACHELGLRPGKDIGLVAFDDVPWAKLLDPPLTVVAQPAYDIGAVATQLLLARIGDNSKPPSTTTLNATLIERASSRRG